MGKIQKMVDEAVKIAKDDSHGYSQYRRWPAQGTDFDCSSLMYWVAHEAGYNVPINSGYTGTMLSDFKKAGWTAVAFDGNLDDLEPGDILLNVSDHTEMYIGDGKFVGAHIAETGGIDGQPGDQTGNEISICPAYIYSSGWDYVLVPPKESDSSTPSGVPTSKTRLNGIDISSWQSDIDIASVEADFVIVKVSGADSYVNPYWKKHAEATLKAGKLLGLYHYACEYTMEPGGKAEAEYFLKQCKAYAGKAIFLLDWEAHATKVNPSYAKAWLDYVTKETKSTPLFYSYANYINNTNLTSITKYPLWVASYPYKYEDGSGYVDNPDMISGTGNWKSATIYQYSSTRYIKGYGSRLDVNVFYGSKSDWEALQGGKSPEPPKPEPTKPVRYRSSVDASGRKWLSVYEDYSGDGHSGQFGTPIRWFACNAKRYRVFTQSNGWLPWVSKFDPSDLEDGCAGDGSPIKGVQIDDDTVCYSVHIIRGKKGAWYDDMHGLVDTGGSGDNFAGDLANQIDAIRCKRM